MLDNLFEQIYESSGGIKKLNECGGWDWSWGKCGGGAPITHTPEENKNYATNKRRHAAFLKKHPELVGISIIGDLPGSQYKSYTKEESEQAWLDGANNRIKSREAAEKRKADAARGKRWKQKVYDDKGITKDQSNWFEKAKRAENQIKDTLREIDNLNDRLERQREWADTCWQNAGGKETWNFRMEDFPIPEDFE